MRSRVNLHNMHKVLRDIDMQEARLERLEHDFQNIWSDNYVFRRIDHAPGWDPLLWEALRAARSIAPTLKLIQIKEKFGGLIIYFENNSVRDRSATKIFAIFADALNKSRRTCEVCGLSGKTYWGRNWVKTLCMDHRTSTEE